MADHDNNGVRVERNPGIFRDPDKGTGCPLPLTYLMARVPLWDGVFDPWGRLIAEWEGILVILTFRIRTEMESREVV